MIFILSILGLILLLIFKTAIALWIISLMIILGIINPAILLMLFWYMTKFEYWIRVHMFGESEKNVPIEFR